MSLEYERERYKLLKSMFDAYKKELYENRLIALDMPIETDNGFNVERETLIDDIDEKLEILRRHIDDPYFAKLIFEDKEDAKAGDPHEIFTACLCLFGKQKLNAISDLS